MSVIFQDSLRISPASFQRLADWIHRELGIQMPPSKLLLIQSRLARRVHELRLQSIDEYCDVVFSSNTERVHLINAVTTNKTDFFREELQLTMLTKTLLPRHRGPGFGIWSAACSTGEEPYSLAMVLSEYALSHPGFSPRILATDVSTKVLVLAKQACYAQKLAERIPAELRRKYVVAAPSDTPGHVLISPALRRVVTFQQLNFMDAQYAVGGTYDVIFCRNVLIYFDRPTQQAVINKLCRHLSPEGHLFVGVSESLTGLKVPLTSLGLSCYRKVG